MNRRISLRRILGGTIIGVLVLLAVGYVALRYYPHPAPGGIGTRVVKSSSLGARGARVLPMGARTAATPLRELLRGGSQHGSGEIIVEKSRRLLWVTVGGRKIKCYFVALGPRPDGTKTRRDDLRTPEGRYYVCQKNNRSRFGLSLLISYPDQKAAENGLRQGNINKLIYDKVIGAMIHRSTPAQDPPLGGSICIHGGGIGSISEDLTRSVVTDWTQGCIAMRSEDIREVFDFAAPGTDVTILP